VQTLSAARATKEGDLGRLQDSRFMLPDLRLLIPATVATFFLAAALGLFASLRIAQEPPFPRSDQLAYGDDTPIARISASWPLPEPGRAAALRDLARVARLNSESDPASDAPISAPEPATAEARDENRFNLTEPPVAPAPAPREAAVSAPSTASDAPAARQKSPAPPPLEATTEGQRIASRPEPAERADPEEKPAQAAPAEVVKPKTQQPRFVKKRTARYARRGGGDPFGDIRPPGFEAPSNFSVFGRHNMPR
jgi:hypothetical protein